LIGAVILGICAGFNSETGIVVGVLLIIIGIIMVATAKPTYHLKVTSAAGEESPLTSKDERYINQVAVALNEALIKRG
jgi:hypothetical protein